MRTEQNFGVNADPTCHHERMPSKAGVLIWRYGAACSSIFFFAASAARNAAPEGRSLVINYAWVRPQARATHVKVILATLRLRDTVEGVVLSVDFTIRR